MDSNLLGAIANNNGISDISAALDYRQARLDKDEAKRKEIQQNQIIGKALSTGLVDGSPMAELAKANPAAYMGLAKVMGIDPSMGSGVNQMTQDAQIISAYGKAGDVNGAINYMQESKAQRDKLGLPTHHLTSGLQAIQEDMPKFFRATNMIADTFHPNHNGAMTEYERAQIGIKQQDQDLANKKYESEKSIEQAKLDLENKKLGVTGVNKPLDAKDIQSIQKDVSTLLQDTQNTHKAALSMENLKDRKTPLAMQAAIIQFNKALDPGSVVRTEEGRIVSSSGGAIGAVIAKFNDAVGKGKLTDEVFDDIVNTSKGIANSAIDSSNQQISTYLEPYGSTIDDKFKTSIKNRVPAKFEGSTLKQPNTDTGIQSLEAKKARLNELRASQTF